MKHILFSLIIFLAATNLYAQTYSYKHYTILDGLAQSQVLNLYQDKKGYIWAATKGGVSRFDGLTFTNFTKKDGLLSLVVLAIAGDKEDNVWFLTTNGICKYANGKIIAYPAPEGVSFKQGADFLADNNDRFFILRGLNPSTVVYSFKDGEYSILSDKYPSLDSVYVYSAYYDILTDRLWLGTRQSGLFYIENDKLAKFTDSTFYVSELFADRENNLYASTGKKGYKIDQQNNRLLVAWDNNSLKGLFTADADNLFWLRDPTGISTFNGKEFIHLNQMFILPHKIFVDNENNKWIATESGLYRLINETFLNFTAESGINSGVWVISEDFDGNMLLGSYSPSSLQLYKDSSFINISNKYAFYFGSIRDKGAVYLASSHSRIVAYRNNSLELGAIRKDDTPLYLFHDSLNGRYLSGAVDGLWEWEKLSELKFHGANEGNPLTYILSINYTKDNQILLTSGKGIAKWDGQNFKLITDTLGATCSYRDYKGNLWLGGKEGLFVYDNETIRKIAPDVFAGSISFLIDTDSLHILVGLMKSMLLFDLESFYAKYSIHYQLFDQSNGFLGIECGQNGAYKDTHGDIWIATSDRVVKFMPNKIMKTRQAPQTFLTDIYVKTDTSDWHIFTSGNFRAETAQRNLHWNENNLQIHFTGISLSNPEKVKYSYMLDGYDQKWSAPVSERMVTYTNLSQGEYTFKVKAANADGVWNIEASFYTFRIVPAWWQTKLFWLLCGIAVISLIVFIVNAIYKQRQKRRERQELMERRITEMQLEIVKGQLDPHFTFNAINAIGSILYTDDKKLAYNYFAKLSGLLREILQTRGTVVKPIRQELDFIRDYLKIEKLRFQDKFEYTLIVGEGVNLDFEIPKMMIHTHIENALKHGLMHKESGGILELQLQQTNDEIEITITDNGIGREAAQKQATYGTGAGTSVMKELLQLFDAANKRNIVYQIEDLTNENGDASGTRVRICIPISYTFKIKQK